MSAQGEFGYNHASSCWLTVSSGMLKLHHYVTQCQIWKKLFCESRFHLIVTCYFYYTDRSLTISKLSSPLGLLILMLCLFVEHVALTALLPLPLGSCASEYALPCSQWFPLPLVLRSCASVHAVPLAAVPLSSSSLDRVSADARWLSPVL